MVTSGLLDLSGAEEAVEEAFGSVSEYTITGANPVPIFPVSDDVEALEGGKPVAGCVNEKMMTDGREEVVVAPADVEGSDGLPLGGATHLVHMVEVDVRVTVETAVVTSSKAVVPEATVLVTGHVVKMV